MEKKDKIKVVKRADTGSLTPSKVKRVTKRGSAREMVATVTEWVSDLKTRKSEETKAAIELLFSAQRPNES